VASEIPKSKVSHLNHESSLLREARLIECYAAAERRLDREVDAFLNRV
jgi:hypothetical protein